jgi:hypothetical protein
MTRKTSDPKSSSRKPAQERRAPRGRPGSVRWLKSLLGRPLGLERRDGQLHIALVERRRPPEVVEADAVQRLCAELRARLLAHGNDHAAVVMRHLVAVHDTLSKRGWSGVEALTSTLLGKALDQAQMLATHEPSRGMVELIERLRVLRAAAQVREERNPTPARGADAAEMEVSETTHEEFENTERSWEQTSSPASLSPEVPK